MSKKEGRSRSYISIAREPSRDAADVLTKVNPENLVEVVWFEQFSLNLRSLAKDRGAFNASGKPDWFVLAALLARKHEPGFRPLKRKVGKPSSRNTDEGREAILEFKRLVDERLTLAKKQNRRQSVNAECMVLAKKPSLLPQYFHTIGRKGGVLTSEALRGYYNLAKREEEIRSYWEMIEALSGIPRRGKAPAFGTHTNKGQRSKPPRK
jgi:hypothetical protein